VTGSKRATHADIVQTIVSRIENGRLLPGSRVIPATIAAEFGISTIPVREALSQMVGRDLIVERHREGFHVAPLNGFMLGAFYTEHGILIDRALALWAKDMRPIGRPGNRWRIFQSIVEQSGNEAMIGVQRYLASRLLPARRREVGFAGVATVTRELLTALRDGNTPEARGANSEFHRICATETMTIVG